MRSIRICVALVSLMLALGVIACDGGDKDKAGEAASDSQNGGSKLEKLVETPKAKTANSSSPKGTVG